MTGYGDAVGRTAAGAVRVELRTVNHRYLNVNARLPSSLARWEGEIREWVRAAFSRGHVSCTIRWEQDGSDPAIAYRLDDEKVSAYLRVFAELAERHGIGGSPDLGLLTRFNDIIVREGDDERRSEVSAEELRPIVGAAARQVVEMREEEGRRLQIDLEERVRGIAVALEEIDRLAPGRLVRERDRLREAVASLVEGMRFDEERLAQEIAMLAERWDVHEELVRFRSHIELFAQLLAAESAEPVGKRLSFLVQEMHREANTIGSKANDAAVAHLVVDAKDELERLREQVENVE